MKAIRQSHARTQQRLDDTRVKTRPLRDDASTYARDDLKHIAKNNTAGMTFVSDHRGLAQKSPLPRAIEVVKVVVQCVCCHGCDSASGASQGLAANMKSTARNWTGKTNAAEINAARCFNTLRARCPLDRARGGQRRRCARLGWRTNVAEKRKSLGPRRFTTHGRKTQLLENWPRPAWAGSRIPPVLASEILVYFLPSHAKVSTAPLPAGSPGNVPHGCHVGSKPAPQDSTHHRASGPVRQTADAGHRPRRNDNSGATAPSHREPPWCLSRFRAGRNSRMVFQAIRMTAPSAVLRHSVRNGQAGAPHARTVKMLARKRCSLALRLSGRGSSRTVFSPRLQASPRPCVGMGPTSPCMVRPPGR